MPLLQERDRGGVAVTLLEDVLTEITPSAEERTKAESVVKEVETTLKGLGARPLLVGSFAKDTDLAGDRDIDLFILFDSETSRDDLEKRGLAIGKKLFSELGVGYDIDYAEHPYVKGAYKGFDFEIVPCYGGDGSELKSSVDRTPLHTTFVCEQAAAGSLPVGDVRLLKKFMKVQGVYGAEAKVLGFNGYLVELLVYRYGSFDGVLEAASTWKFGEILDPAGLWEDASALNYYFTDAVLVVVDPVDQDRNVAAAVSRQKMAEFMAAARGYLREPSREWFFPPAPSPPACAALVGAAEKRGTTLAVVAIGHPVLNVNSLYGQLRRTLRAVASTAESYGFHVFKSGFWTDEGERSYLVVEFDVAELPAVERLRGPPLDTDVPNQERFLAKYLKNPPYIEDGYWFVDKPRRHTVADAALSKCIGARHGFGKDFRASASFALVSLRKALEDCDAVGFRLMLGEFLRVR